VILTTSFNLSELNSTCKVARKEKQKAQTINSATTEKVIHQEKASNNTLHRLNSTRYTQQSVHTTATATNMSTSQSQSSSTPPTSSSENLISNILKQGSERGILYISAGLVFGGLASIVLARGGGGSGARKAITAFGTGVGTGDAWTRCSIDIEDAVKDMK